MEEVALALARQLANVADVHLVTTPMPNSAQLGDFRAMVHELDGICGRYSPQWMNAVDEYCERYRPDVVLGVSAAARQVAARAVRPYPVVLQAHGTSVLELKRRLRGGGLRGAIGAARAVRGLASDLRAYRRYDAVVAISPTVATSLEMIPRPFRAKRIVEISNGIAVSVRSRHDVARDEAQAAVLFVGRLHAQKGVHILIQAIAMSNARLTIVGSGNEEGKLRTLVGALSLEERVTFTGQLPNSELHVHYENADVVVAPSLGNEGLPTVLLEALNAGTPVVTSPAGAAGFGTMPYGMLVAEPKPAAIDEAIKRAIRIDRSRVTLPPQYSVARAADRYMDLFRQVIEMRQQRGS